MFPVDMQVNSRFYNTFFEPEKKQLLFLRAGRYMDQR